MDMIFQHKTGLQKIPQVSVSIFVKISFVKIHNILMTGNYFMD